MNAATHLAWMMNPNLSAEQVHRLVEEDGRRQERLAALAAAKANELARECGPAVARDYLGRALRLIVFLMTIAAPPLAAVFCPTDATTGCGASCPTQQECDAGWTWASPNRAMVLYPVSLVRFADGRLAVNQCTLDIVAYPPWSNPRDGQAIPPCGSGFPPSVSLRVWCDAVKNLPLPAECSTVPCVRPGYVGVCGL